MRSRSLRGFTLIELLVVIAIIGILSSVVLASLVVARLKGADAAVKSNMHTLQTNMELYYDNVGNYGGAQSEPLAPSNPRTSIAACGSTAFECDSKARNALQGALAQSGAIRYAVGPSGGSYAVASKLPGDGRWWCLDATNTPVYEPSATFGGTGQVLGGGSSVARCP